MRLRLLTALSLCVFAVLATALSAGAKQQAPEHILKPNPANDRSLIGMRMDPVQYDGGGNCVRKNPPGMDALIKWMKKNTRKNVPYGTIRCDGGVHGTGRALDWMLDARKHSQKQLAMTVINTWMADDKRGRDNALARRMGVQLIIYNCRYWQAGDKGWNPYSECSGGKANADPTQGHIDHVHIELTKAAARLKTSFWKQGAPSGGGGGGGGGIGGGGIGPGAASR
jgi:hypothetical protein